MRVSIEELNQSDEDDVESLTAVDPVQLSEPTLQNIANGAFILAKFKGRRRLTFYRSLYMVLQEPDPDDWEVMFISMKCVDDNKTVFKTNEQDASFVEFDNVLGVLPQPILYIQGVHYKFSGRVDIFQ